MKDEELVYETLYIDPCAPYLLYREHHMQRLKLAGVEGLVTVEEWQAMQRRAIMLAEFQSLRKSIDEIGPDWALDLIDHRIDMLDIDAKLTPPNYEMEP